MINNFNKEELRTYIGYLMLDVRGSWGWNDEDRIEDLKDCFLILKDMEDDVDRTNEINAMIELCDEELEDSIPNNEFDGRTFRYEYLYGYSSDEGQTQRVKDWLVVGVNYPEYFANWDVSK